MLYSIRLHLGTCIQRKSRTIEGYQTSLGSE
jgi:hypothetical protein